ncbi:MAG: TA system VapC family ribonuclease toxin [Pirellulales bacterium]
MKVIDVNILAYLVSQPAQHHKQIFAWWNAALLGNEALALSWTVINGFLRVATNPKALQFPLSAEDAIERVDAWLSHPSICLISELDNHWQVFRGLVQEHDITGKQVTDAHIAALAISRGALLVSCDRDFSRFRQLRWENPAD